MSRICTVTTLGGRDCAATFDEAPDVLEVSHIGVPYGVSFHAVLSAPDGTAIVTVADAERRMLDAVDAALDQLYGHGRPSLPTQS